MAITGLLTLVAAPLAAQGGCVGDCDGDDSVSVSELITGVNIALGAQSVENCEAMDADRNGSVTVNELIAAVNSALVGCGEPGQELGERVFTVLDETATTEDSRTALWVSVLAPIMDFPNVADAVRAQPMRLVAGAPDADGRAPLRLANDVWVALEVGRFGGVLCMQFLSEGSHGWVDCDGGPAPDVVVTQATGSTPDLPTDVVVGEGEPTGPGAGVLLVSLAATLQGLPLGSTAEDCASGAVTLDLLLDTALTTATGTAVKGEWETLSLEGENFSCDGWRTTDSAGLLVAPFPMFMEMVGDVAAVLKLADN
jgi:hypothetical protein